MKQAVFERLVELISSL